MPVEDRAVNACQAVNLIVNVLKVYSASATAFCSSYISIPAKTSTIVSV